MTEIYPLSRRSNIIAEYFSCMAGYVRAADREVQLLEAAKRVLIRDGYQGLTLRTVAAEADVRLSTLQYIFRTRSDLVVALSDKVMEDCGFTAHRGGVRGLAVELHDAANWYGSRVLVDPGMRELLRAEFIANVSSSTGPDDYPAGRPIFGGVLPDWLRRMESEGNEVFAVGADDIAILCVNGFSGLTYQYLQTGDLEQYQRDAEVLVAAAVALAAPVPKVG